MWLVIAAINLALAVILGAFGAHSLEKIATPQQIGWWQTGSDYFFYHALGLLLLAILNKIIPLFPILTSFVLLQLGILGFSGSLFLMAVGVQGLGLVTPIGGLCFILGWLLLAFNALKYRKMSS